MNYGIPYTQAASSYWAGALQRSLATATSPQEFPMLARLRSTPQRIAGVFAAWRDALAVIEYDERLSATAKTDDRQAATASALAALETIEAQTESYLRDARREYAPKPPARDANERIARELEEAKVWRRVREQLDAGVPLEDVIKAADLTGVDVIEAELPSYLRAKHPDGPEVTAGELARADQLIEQRRYALMPETEYADRVRLRKTLAELDTGANNVKTALAYVRYALETGQLSAIIVPDWPRGLVVRA